MGRNQLEQEKSPYLLQHKDNPVWWYPWGEEAFSQARAQDKPIFLSIGYSTCHWCHVMEVQSFVNPEVAEVLNKHFISIKVDREERPDVDDIYMTAVQAISGHGGWPLSVWLTPDGLPFFGGTYFPPDQFVGLLKKIHELWMSQRDQIENDGEKLSVAIKKLAHVNVGKEQLDTEQIKAVYIDALEQSYDDWNGGFGGAPKFPQTMSLMSLMRLRERSSRSATMVCQTLDAMARGGIFDQVGGGFHRYSVDEQWLVPHFEKMLYDNALLSHTYLEAYQLYKQDDYKVIAQRTVDFVLERLTHPEGGFYCAIDADSLIPDSNLKMEGYFYTYEWNELKNNLDDEELTALVERFGATQEGNFEGRIILHIDKDDSIAELFSDAVVLSALRKLEDLRNQRPYPHVDDKVLTSWNGWMITSLGKAYQVLKDEKYLKAAQRALQFLLDNLYVDGTLFRRWREGEAKIEAYAEDYAGLIQALLATYQCDFNEEWYRLAVELQEKMDALFWDQEHGGYYRDSGSDKNLPARMKEDSDGVTPNANSLAALNLLTLFHLSMDGAYEQRAMEVLRLFQKRMLEYPMSLPQMVAAIDFYSSPVSEVALISESLDQSWEFVFALSESFLPYTVIASKPSASESGIPILEGRDDQSHAMSIYVCSKGSCQQPVTDIKAALDLIRGRQGQNL